MTIIRNKTTIDLTEEERKAIKVVASLANEIYYNLDNDETDRFDSIMKASWAPNTGDVEISICSLSSFLDSFQNNIDEFNS